jgi:hypothetical protein
VELGAQEGHKVLAATVMAAKSEGCGVSAKEDVHLSRS